MGCCEKEEIDTGLSSDITIALAGNPNCGKSALFNTLTGIRQKTGNWPGVTVERKQGHFSYDNNNITTIDLPGIYSLDASSLDEEVTRDYLLSHDADLIINVVDAGNLERNLYLTVQLLEMGVPIVVALNMMDVARKRGISIDTHKLSVELGCPVVPIVAISGEGIELLLSQTAAVTNGSATGGYRLAHEECVEQAISDLLPLIQDREQRNKHWLALKLLESDSERHEKIDSVLKERLDHWRKHIEKRAGEDADIFIADTRYSHAHSLAQSVTREKGRVGRTLTDKIDRAVLSRIFGIPIFLAVMYLMFMFTISIGGAFIDFFDGIAGAIFVDGFKEVLGSVSAPEWLKVVLADGIGGGIQIVATFIPIITALYLFLSIIEDSGYMARAAFVMDRFMRSIGLPGKAFVPLIVGFGCNVPAVMATRTLESERERKLTILMNPFMSCGARLPVYALFAAAFFPANGQNIVFALYLIGIIVAILTGMIMKQTLLSGTSTGFMMELPPYHLPTLKGILLRTWDRVRLFMREAGKIIVVMVLALNLLNSIGTDGSFGNEDSETSILSSLSKSAVPLFEPLGIHEDNWPAILGIISGVLAKEVVVGTLDTLYSNLAMSDAGETREEAFDFRASIAAAFATVPENLGGVSEMLGDPLGMDVGDVENITSAAESQQVNEGTFGAMASRFDGRVGAFAYLLFILLYFPCVATIGAIKREAGGAWAGFVALWTTSVAYIASTNFYQIATFPQHSIYSSVWISGSLLMLAACIVGLRMWARKGDKGIKQPAQVQA
ncbi:MAG: Fe(2+) transporter permease subunit FeoB [Gammaproteobacteria bacterium]|nr:Fe(2+) transporter permease subunit FeoB [Gammaproteobacteria bacterium]